MSYCIRCGKQTENEDFICDECRARQSPAANAGAPDAQGGAENAGAQQGSPQGGAGVPPAGGQGWQPRANTEQPYRNTPYGNAPYTPWAAPYVPPAPPEPVDRSKLPLNKCGLIGMIFSLAAVFLFILMFIIVVAAIAQNPEWVDNPFYEPTAGEMAGLMLGVLIPLFLGFASSVTGIVLSSVGLARYKRFRSVGFAIAGLAVGVITLLIFLSFFGV